MAQALGVFNVTRHQRPIPKAPWRPVFTPVTLPIVSKEEPSTSAVPKRRQLMETICSLVTSNTGPCDLKAGWAQMGVCFLSHWFSVPGDCRTLVPSLPSPALPTPLASFCWMVAMILCSHCGRSSTSQAWQVTRDLDTQAEKFLLILFWNSCIILTHLAFIVLEEGGPVVCHK